MLPRNQVRRAATTEKMIRKRGTLIDPIEEVAKESVEIGEDEGKVKVGTSEAVEEKDE